MPKIEHALNDVYYDGLTYELLSEDKCKAKGLLYCFRKNKDKHYTVKKPKWAIRR